jgi:tetratricopeptide (TPR) repeat protein
MTLRHLLFLLVPAILNVGCFKGFDRKPWESNSAEPSVSSSNPLPTPGGHGATELPGKESAALNLSMAESLEREGKDLDSVVYYEKARQLDPSLADRVSRRLAVVYDRLDEQALAMKEYRALLEKFPKDSALLCDLGYSFYNRGQWAEAEKYLQKSVSWDSSNKRAWVNLGMTHAQQGKYSEALAAFEKGVSPAEARSNLGFILAVRGKKSEAIQAYQSALQLEPTLHLARVALEKLQNGETVQSAGSRIAGAGSE